MEGRKISIFTVGILLVTTALLLSACGAIQSCDHEWQEASCLMPMTCAICGATEGEPAPHTWGDTSCASPEPCAVCGTLDGVTITHQWREDTQICALCGLDARSTDERFMESLAKGLDARWELINATEKKKPTTKEDFEGIFNAEYEQVSQYKGMRFENADLEELANQYIDCVIAAKEALIYHGTDQWKDQYHNSVYHRQTVVLFNIHTISPIPVGEETTDFLQDLLNNGETIQMVSQLFDEVFFHKIKNYDGTYRYEALVKNITSLQFATFTFEVHLLDADRNLLATETITETAWEPGEKRWFVFYPDVECDIIDVKYADWTF